MALAEYKKGEDGLMKASEANKLVDGLNKIYGLTVTPDGLGSFSFGATSGEGASNAKLQLNTFEMIVCVEIEGVKTEKRALVVGFIL